MSWVTSMTAVPCSRAEALDQRDDLRLHRDVERGGRLVGDDQLRLGAERERDHDALAHAAGEFVRIGVDALLRRGNADLGEQIDGALARRGRREIGMGLDRLDRSGRRSGRAD